jgi:3D (Asp-Asp-Asp) domain-containing protein
MKKTFIGSGVFAFLAISVVVLLTISAGNIVTGQDGKGPVASPKTTTAPVANAETPEATAPAEPLKTAVPAAKKPAAKAAPTGPSRSFVATCYSLRGRMANGAFVHSGAIAADPRVLPLGTRVYVSAGSLSGEYVVKDTGGVIKGRKIDIWVPSTRQAMSFGRRTVQVTVLSGRRSNSGAAKATKSAQSNGNQQATLTRQ